MEEKLQELRNLLHGVKGTFVCSGVASPDNQGVIVSLTNGPQVVFSGKLSEEAVKPLVQDAPQAPFGQGRHTLYNKEVRDAKQYKFADGSFSVANFDPARAGILDIVKSKLLPHDPSPLIAELYNLNIYESKGHFKPHRDTPRGADMVGTLVVCLPTSFYGGEFIVKHQDSLAQYDWSKDIRESNKDPKSLNWVAFFGDCEHSINKISYGNRVTLSYILRKGAPSETIAPFQTIQGDAIVQEMHAKLQAFLQDTSFMPEGGSLGVPCGHLYTNEPTFTKPLPGLTNATAMKLKGNDQKFALAAVSAGLNVSLVPLIQESCADYQWQLEYFPKKIAKLPWKLSTEALCKKFPVKEDVTDGDEQDPTHKVKWIEPRPVSMSRTRGSFLAPGQTENPNPEVPALLAMGRANWSDTGYFGNEASETEFYIYAALIVKIPPVKNGVREQPVPLPELPAPEPESKKRKYIESTWPIEMMFVPQLKEALKARGLKVTGSKLELQERMRQYERENKPAKELKIDHSIANNNNTNNNNLYNINNNNNLYNSNNNNNNNNNNNLYNINNIKTTTTTTSNSNTTGNIPPHSNDPSL